MIRVKKAAILLSALFMVSHQARALSPDLVKEVGFPGDPFDVSIDESSGEVIVWTIEANEVVTYDRDGNKLADCTAPQGLGNFSLDPFDETSVPSTAINDGTPYSDFNYTGSRVTRIAGSVVNVVNTDIPHFFAIDCNNPATNLDVGDDVQGWQVRYAERSNFAVGMSNGSAASWTGRQVGVFSGQLVGQGPFDEPNAIDRFWTPVVAQSNQQGGFRFDRQLGIYRAYADFWGYLGDSEGQVTHIDDSPAGPGTAIFTDGGVTRYRVLRTGDNGTFSNQGFDIVDVSSAAFLVSDSSRCLLIENSNDISESTSVGTECAAFESSGDIIFVIADGLLRVFDTNPVAIDSSTGCDYSDADLYDGWGWNAATQQGCPPEDNPDNATDGLNTDDQQTDSSMTLLQPDDIDNNTSGDNDSNGTVQQPNNDNDSQGQTDIPDTVSENTGNDSTSTDSTDDQSNDVVNTQEQTSGSGTVDMFLLLFLICFFARYFMWLENRTK